MNDDETLPGEFLLGTLDPHEQMFVFAPVTSMIAARIDDDGTVRLSKDTVTAIQSTSTLLVDRDAAIKRVEELELEAAEGRTYLDKIRRAMKGYEDSDLASLGEALQASHERMLELEAQLRERAQQPLEPQPAAGEVPERQTEVSLIFIVNGEPIVVQARLDGPLSEARDRALAESQNSGRPRDDWEIRTDYGVEIPADEPVWKNHFKAGTRLFLTLRLGIGGGGQPTAAEVPACACGDPDAECPVHDGDGDPPPQPAAGCPPPPGERPAPALLDELAQLRDELAQLRDPGFHEFVKLCQTWLEHYPADLFDGSSGDRGSPFVTAIRAAVAAFDESAQQFHPGFSTSRTTVMANHPRQSSDPDPDGHDEPCDGCGGVGYPPSAEVESEPCSHRCVPAGEDGDCVGVGLQFVGMAQGEAEFCVSIGERTAHWFVSQEMWNAFAEAAGWLPVEQLADPPCYCAETSTRNCPAHAPLLFEETSLDRGGETEPSVDRDWAACPHRWVVDEVLSGQATPADAPEACALAQRVLWAAANPTGSKR